MSRRAAIAALVILAAAARTAAAQEPAAIPNVGGRSEVFAGGELENYLRYLQTLGEVAPYPWGVRAFSPKEVDRLLPADTAHPWAARYDLKPRTGHGPTVDWVAPTGSVRFNSAFPYGYNDGPIWAGRGLTLAAQFGVAMRWGALSATIAPMGFAAQNASFSLMPNGESGRLAYADGVLWDQIDRPQRFGSTMYARLDPGQSTVRLDWGPVAMGVSTANHYWGPATEFPMILGDNAAGFPHAFAGTAHPVDLWLFRVHFRFIWGRLEQSAFAAATASAGVRLATGLNVDLSSRWMPGLEVGFTRFSHQPWPAGGLRLRDLSHILRTSQASFESVVDNQLASAFFRWVLPHSGFEVYGEYGRDDFNLDLRDFIGRPDRIGGYTIGFRKVMRRASNRLLAVRVEVQNMQATIAASEGTYAPFYTHGSERQGHTQLGQVIGSAAGTGGAAAVVAVDAYAATGRWTVSWTRMLRQQLADSAGVAAPGLKGLDVQHELAVERLAFLGRYDLLAHLGAVYEFNRNFGGDAFNLNLQVAVRVGIR